MINEEKILNIIDGIVKEKNAYIVDLKVSPSNKIIVEVDSFDSVTIDDCVEISRLIENNFDREKEDFELEVSSPGLSVPFKVWQQYKKNEGKEVEAVLKDGSKIKGVLSEVSDEAVTIAETKKVKVEGKKKKQTVVEKHQLTFDQIKSTKVVIQFK
ncbi:MAG: ribosome assembly cofactor RimP [Bacteroidales bacterium]